MTQLPLYLAASGLLATIAFGFSLRLHALHQFYRREYLHLWRTSWFLLGLYAVFSGVAFTAVTSPTLAALRSIASILSLSAAYAHLIWLAAGASAAFAPRTPRSPYLRRLLGASGVLLASLIVVAPMDGQTLFGMNPRFLLRVMLLAILWGIAYSWVGIRMLRATSDASQTARRQLGFSLIAYGVVRLMESGSYALPGSPLLTEILILIEVSLAVAVGVAMLVTLLDVERARLLARDARFRRLIENASDMIFMVTPAGEVLYSSPSVERVLGRSAQSLAGRIGFEIVHPEDEPALRDAMLRAFQNDESVPAVVPFRARAANGDWIRLEAVSRPFVDDDGAPRLIVSVRDVRERHRLEAELTAARRLESVGRLAGGVAHDFNNLLTAILGNVSLMRRAEHPSPEDVEDLDDIEKAALRGAELTRRLLAFARRQMIEPRVIDLGRELNGLFRLLERLLGEHASLRLRIADDLWSMRADPSAIEQALVNLVVNARDAMPHGGGVTVIVSNEEIPEAGIEALAVPAGRWVRLQVCDTGIGMDESVIGRIFEPFFTTKTEMGGTGLGLSTVFGIVAQAGGHVRVHSVVGAGSTFSLYFPMVEESPAASEASTAVEASAPRARGHETILLIEDEGGLRQTVARVLRELGYFVLTAADGEEGIAIAGGHNGRIELVLTDLVMPNVGGGEAAARIRAERPSIKVLFVSGFSEAALEWRAAASPRGEGLITKPFTPSQLAHAVREQIDR